MQLREEDNELGGLNSEKIQKRVKYVKTAFADSVYNVGRFNFTMLEWAIKEIIKEERASEPTVKEESGPSRASQAVEIVKGYSKFGYLLFLLPVLLIFFNMYAL